MGRVILFYVGVGVFFGLLSVFIKRTFNVSHDSRIDSYIGPGIVVIGIVVGNVIFNKLIKSGRFTWFLKV